MAEFRNFPNRAATQADASIDEGLRTYMLKVYNLLGIGVAITGIAAYVISTLASTNDPALAVGQLPNGIMLTDLGAAIYTSPLRWAVMFAPLALVMFLGFRINKMSVSAAQTTFWAYSALVGLSISYILLIYTGESVVRTFFITATAFGGLSLYGYTTKRDLSGMGSFMVMGLFGLLIAMIVNLFLQSSAMQWVISVAGVIIFSGLTAWDTQKIKEMYYEGDDATTAGRKAIMGALTLYLDFINLFMFLLHFLGNKE